MLNDGLEKTFSSNLVTYIKPNGSASEAYRNLRAGIRYLQVDNEIKTIIITSAQPMDGKSTTASNLAISMAQAGRKTLLVDGDLRKPKIHSYFKLVNARGLSSIIIEGYDVTKAITPVHEVEHLYLLTSGPTTPYPSELMESQKMEELFNRLKNDYDCVIFDMPPAGQFSDATILARSADGVIMVVAVGNTRIDMAQKTKQRLENMNARILGVVLTKTKNKVQDNYYGYYA